MAAAGTWSGPGCAPDLPVQLPERAMADRQDLLSALVLVTASLCAGLAGCAGIEADVAYPNDMPSDYDKFLVTPEGGSSPSLSLGAFKVKTEACQGVDLHPITQPLNQDDLARFLETQGVKIVPKKARANLYWFDFPNGTKHGYPRGFTRLRVAILDNPGAAAKDLHDSLLDHGPGWWGVRRSNIAILAPKTGVGEAMSFAVKYKLACWGIVGYAGRDDAYVIPGPYAEL